MCYTSGTPFVSWDQESKEDKRRIYQKRIQENTGDNNWRDMKYGSSGGRAGAVSPNIGKASKQQLGSPKHRHHRFSASKQEMICVYILVSER